MIEKKNCEGTDCLNAALSSGMTSLYVLIASASGVGWGSNEAVTLLYLIPYPVPICTVCNHKVQQHF